MSGKRVELAEVRSLGIEGGSKGENSSLLLAMFGHGVDIDVITQLW